jgi:hypothetical protein
MGMLGATGNNSWSGNFPLLSFVFVFFIVCLFLFEVALFFSIVSYSLMDRPVFVLSLDFLRNQCEFFV